MCASTPRKGSHSKKALKQAWRPKSTNSVCPVNVPHRSEPDNIPPGTKYANTGRKAKSFHGPTVMAHLQSLQSQLSSSRLCDRLIGKHLVLDQIVLTQTILPSSLQGVVMERWWLRTTTSIAIATWMI